jgi:hypothetical protein
MCIYINIDEVPSQGLGDEFAPMKYNRSKNKSPITALTPHTAQNTPGNLPGYIPLSVRSSESYI